MARRPATGWNGRACCSSSGSSAAAGIAWLPEAARALFLQAVGDGWDTEKGGFYYTLDWAGAPRLRDRYWWPCCEGIGAAACARAL